MLRPITKAVIAVAGYGTRFLPATKNQPKEMLPIVDKPIIQYLVEEAVDSGIKDVILVTRAGQTSLEDYFDSHVELEHTLELNGKEKYLEQIRKIPQLANFIYVRQKRDLPYGNASPILAAAPLLDDDEAFVYMFGDDVTMAQVPVTKQLIEVYKKHQPSAVLGVQEVPDSDVERYATIKYKKDADNKYEMEEGFEKAPATQAPSNMAQFGRFVFGHAVVEKAAQTPLGKSDELWVIDVLNQLAREGEKVIAQPIEGKWMTTGDPLRYLQTTIEFALQREDIGTDLRAYLKGLKL